MFSLIITIISIALVVALAVATAYYGATIWSSQKASVTASTTTNQASQIYSASLLFSQDNAGCWPDTPSQLSGKDPSNVSCTGRPNTVSYLGTVPVPPLAQADSVMANAYAADGPNWTIIKNSQGRIQYLHIAQGLSSSVCKAVQRQAKSIGLFEALLHGGDEITTNLDPKLTYQCADDNSPTNPSPNYSYYWLAPGGMPACDFLPKLNDRNADLGLNSNLTCNSSSTPTEDSGLGGYWLVGASVPTGQTSSSNVPQLTSFGYSATCSSPLVPFPFIDPTGTDAVRPVSPAAGEKLLADSATETGWSGEANSWGYPLSSDTMMRFWCIPAYDWEVTVPAFTELASAMQGGVDTLSLDPAVPGTDFTFYGDPKAYSAAATITGKGQAWTIVASGFDAWPYNPANEPDGDEPGIYGRKIAIGKVSGITGTYFRNASGMVAPSNGTLFSNMAGRIIFEPTVHNQPAPQTPVTLTPTSGPTTGGTTVTLKGQNFPLDVRVQIGNFDANVVSNTATEIVIVTQDVSWSQWLTEAMDVTIVGDYQWAGEGKMPMFTRTLPLAFTYIGLGPVITAFHGTHMEPTNVGNYAQLWGMPQWAPSLAPDPRDPSYFRPLFADVSGDRDLWNAHNTINLHSEAIRAGDTLSLTIDGNPATITSHPDWSYGLEFYPPAVSSPGPKDAVLTVNGVSGPPFTLNYSDLQVTGVSPSLYSFGLYSGGKTNPTPLVITGKNFPANAHVAIWDFAGAGATDWSKQCDISGSDLVVTSTQITVIPSATAVCASGVVVEVYDPTTFAHNVTSPDIAIYDNRFNGIGAWAAQGLPTASAYRQYTTVPNAYNPNGGRFGVYQESFGRYYLSNQCSTGISGGCSTATSPTITQYAYGESQQVAGYDYLNKAINVATSGRIINYGPYAVKPSSVNANGYQLNAAPTIAADGSTSTYLMVRPGKGDGRGKFFVDGVELPPVEAFPDPFHFGGLQLPWAVTGHADDSWVYVLQLPGGASGTTKQLTFQFEPAMALSIGVLTYGSGPANEKLVVTFFGSWTQDTTVSEIVLTNDVNVPASCMSSGNVSAQNLCMRDYFQSQLGTGAACSVSFSGAATEVVAKHPGALKEEFLYCTGVSSSNLAGVAVSFPEGYKVH